MSKIRTRYAPSPTGYFHIGGARTALFNYLYAKHYNGEFILRIEDTDIERNVENGIKNQIDNLKWLGIFVDESIENPTEYGPYIQSLKFDVYKKYAYELLNKKLAYRCFCTTEELERARENSKLENKTPKYSRKCLWLNEDEINQKLKNNIPFAIRLKINNQQEFLWHDLIRGPISIPGSALTDPVILKSNQIATYNFAVVIDDHDMHITHIFRGEEHLSNTPYQIAIKEALNFNDKFNYGHLSIIVDETGKKLSKRNLNVEQFIEGFKEKGYLPNALVNFIALLGWSDAKNKEILSLSELIKDFSIDRISSAPAFFDIKKLNWISNEYFKKMDDEIYSIFVSSFIKTDNPFLKGKEKELALLFKKNLSYGQQINQFINETFCNTLSWNELDANIQRLVIDNPNSKLIIENLITNLNNLQTWTSIEIKKAINEVGTKINIFGKYLFMPIRLLITSHEHGPELATIISIYQKQTIINFLKECYEKIK